MNLNILWTIVVFQTFLFVNGSELENEDAKCQRGYKECSQNMIDAGAKGFDYLAGRMMCGVAYLGCKYEPKLDCLEKCHDAGMKCIENAKKFSEGMACIEDGFQCIREHCSS